MSKKTRNIQVPLEAHPNPNRPASVQNQMSVTHAHTFSGPIPPPQMLAEYEKILPGSSDRILTLAEKQSAHRQELEKIVIQSDKNNSRRGQVFGFIITMTMIAIGTFLLYMGKPIGGFAAIFGSLASLLAAFIYGTKSRKNERQQKK